MDELQSARQAILDLGSEDYYGLYDALAYLPAIPSEKRLAVAKAAVGGLAQEGLIRVCKGSWDKNEFKDVPANDLDAVLGNPESWIASSRFSDEVYVFINTDSGDSAYNEGRTA